MKDIEFASLPDLGQRFFGKAILVGYICSLMQEHGLLMQGIDLNRGEEFDDMGLWVETNGGQTEFDWLHRHEDTGEIYLSTSISGK